MNTSCKICYFSNTADSDKPCEFDIIKNIKDDKKLSIQDGFYIINDYRCRYGFSRQQYEKNEGIFKEINLKEYILENIPVSYYLIIDHRSEVSVKDLCDSINRLQIKPKFISILCYEANMNPIVKDLEDYLEKGIKWKTHNFLTKTTSLNMAIKTALDTSHDIANIQYLWINKSESISDLVNACAIEKINYLVNIKQPVCNFIRSKNSDDLYTMFLNTSTYKYITKNINQMLEDGIRSIDTVCVCYDN